MAKDRQTRSHTATEVARIVNDVPDDSDVSSFEGKEGHDASIKFFSLD